MSPLSEPRKPASAPVSVDPQGPLDAGHGVQLRDQLVPARVATRVGENDQTQAESRGEPEHDEHQEQARPGHDSFEQLGHLTRTARPGR